MTTIQSNQKKPQNQRTSGSDFIYFHPAGCNSIRMGCVVVPPSFYQLLLKIRDCILIPDCLSRLKT